ncbi:MAG: hypothetical protein HXY34_06265 [Candidatus Thorarchaeota archaeon]|nr:hypothetical protein [Candidatus Thorarchaeota archaeon]
MIVPGTTVGITLLPGYVEVRDKGRVEKKIKIKNRSFEEVLGDLEVYFKTKGKMLAPSIIRDSLIRIGVPQVRVILVGSQVQETEETSTASAVVEEPSGQDARTPTPAVQEVSVRAAERLTTVPQESTASMAQPVTSAAPHTLTEPEPEVRAKKRQSIIELEPIKVEAPSLTGTDLVDIEQALSAVEKLSDSFLAAGPQDSLTSPEQPHKRSALRIDGQEEIVASAKSHAAAPEVIPEQAQGTTSVSSAAPRTVTVSEGETGPTGVPTTSRKTPEHVVKPLVKAKALILGEDTVGKHTLMQKAGLVKLASEEDNRPYVYQHVFELDDYRVQLNVWCFDDAAKSGITRKEFYSDAQVVMIVYSASDRWSFESVDFWLKEVSLVLKGLPPVVITANKKDLRRDEIEDGGPQPVSSDEGFKYAEYLATKLGSQGKLHPVAFIETSCLTSEGVVTAFRTAAELHVQYTLEKQ